METGLTFQQLRWNYGKLYYLEQRSLQLYNVIILSAVLKSLVWNIWLKVITCPTPGKPDLALQVLVCWTIQWLVRIRTLQTGILHLHSDSLRHSRMPTWRKACRWPSSLSLRPCQMPSISSCKQTPVSNISLLRETKVLVSSLKRSRPENQSWWHRATGS